MKEMTLLDEAKLVEKAVRVLVRHLGPIEATRFLSLPQAKREESVKRHRAWQGKLNKGRFFAEVFGSK